MSQQKKKKKGKLIVLLVIVAIIGFIIFSITRCSKAAMDVLIKQEAATRRDIQNYHSFTGTISAKDEQSVFPERVAKVDEVRVKKGDHVKKGDVIMVLNSDDISNSIAELEATMSINQANAAYTVSEATRTYNNYVYNVENKYDTSLNSSRQQVETALENWVLAKKEYDNEVLLNSKGYSQTLISSTSSIDTAYNNLLSAQATYNGVYGNANSTEEARTQATASRENAEINYQMAIKNYEAAKINEDIRLTKLYDNLIQAQNRYYNAVDNYNAVKVQSNQQMEAYRMNIGKAELGADQTLNEIKLARLYEDLDKCLVKAPCDGIITTLDVKEGDFTQSGKSVAAITNYDVLQVKIKINEYDINTIGEGSKVEIYLNALERTCEGEITYIDRNATVENGVSYFAAEVTFAGEDDIRCGMSVEIKSYTDNRPNVITVPAEAISTRDDGSTYVRVVTADNKDGEERDVETGISDDTYIEIISGLDEGEVIIYMPEMFNSYAELMEESANE